MSIRDWANVHAQFSERLLTTGELLTGSLSLAVRPLPSLLVNCRPAVLIFGPVVESCKLRVRWGYHRQVYRISSRKGLSQREAKR